MPQPYSEKTAHAIDHEAQAIVARMADRAYHLLASQRKTLEDLAQYLLDHETIVHSTLMLLLADIEPTTPREASASNMI